MSFKLPEQFPAGEDDIVLNFDHQIFIQHHTKEDCFNRPVVLEQHLIMMIQKGAKIMTSTEGQTTLYKNELLFLEKGTYLSSEKILEDGLFSSMLFFFKEQAL